MIDASFGWAIASNLSEEAIGILRTTDGAQTWSEVTPLVIPSLPGVFPGPVRAEFLGRDRAWLAVVPVAGCGGVAGCPEETLEVASSLWHTEDGGRTWESSSLPGSWNVISLEFIDERHGWFMSENYVGAGSSDFRLFRTRDGGRNWEVLIGEDHGVQEYSLAFSFFDTNFGLMTFAHDFYYVLTPYVRWTQEGGASWGEFINVPAPADDPELFARAFCGTSQPRLFSPVSAVISVDCHDPGTRQPVAHLLYSTSDAARSWQYFDHPGGEILFLDPQLGWALGHELYQTQSGGKAWMRLGSVVWRGQFSFVDESHGWAVGESASASTRIYALYATQDGGRSWMKRSPVLMP